MRVKTDMFWISGGVLGISVCQNRHESGSRWTLCSRCHNGQFLHSCARVGSSSPVVTREQNRSHFGSSDPSGSSMSCESGELANVKRQIAALEMKLAAQAGQKPNKGADMQTNRGGGK
eukprot:6307461-Amphidinium_carterae.1